MPRKPAARKPRRRAPRRKAASKNATVALIKNVIAREQETKYVSYISSAGADYNSSITGADIIDCLPPLLQDSGEGNAYERLGVKITPRSLTVKCHVSFGPSITRSSAITVYWYLLTAKASRNLTQLSSNVSMSRLLRAGNSNQYLQFDGTAYNAMLPVNNSDFTVLKRGSFNLQKNTGVVQDSTAGGNQPLVGPVSKTWSMKLDPPAKLTYEPDNASPRTVYFPNNYAPFLVFGYVHQDQSASDLVNQDIRVTVASELWYDDA